MGIKETLELTPETLASRQHAELTEYACKRLHELAGLIASCNYLKALDMLFNSPAGDGHGCDNSCISFEETGIRDEPGCDTDISDVIDRLVQLKRVIDDGNKKGEKK